MFIIASANYIKKICTVIVTPILMFDQTTGYLSVIKLTHKINHHSPPFVNLAALIYISLDHT